MSTKLLFFLHSEDYETPAADDAEKWWVETMTRHGITVCINVVGELARALRARGRQDVIQAMARHDIAYHSDMHSAYPTWAEYLDTSGWDGGVARVLREEGSGIADVAETFGQQPRVWCKPGCSWGPQVAHAMVQMDLPVFCDAPFETEPGWPLWFDNSLFVTYHHHFDGYFSVPHKRRLAKMQADFEAKATLHDGGYLSMFTHPCRLFTTRFSDTFSGGKNPPRDTWKPCPLRPRHEIDELQQDFDAFLGWVVRQPYVELGTHRELYKSFQQPAAPWLSADQMRQLCATVSEFTYQRINGEYLSPAEQFSAVVRAVAADDGLRSSTPVRRLLGPTTRPREVTTAGSAPWRAVVDAARWIEAYSTPTRAVPGSIPLGSDHVGPNAFLQAAARALTQQQPPATVTVEPVDEHPAITQRNDFRKMRFKGTWSELSREFEGQNVLEMIRLQAWTAKPAVAWH